MKRVVFKTQAKPLSFYKNMTKEQRQDYVGQKCAELHAKNEQIKSVRNNRNEADMIENDDVLLTTSGFYDIPYHCDIYGIA